MLRRPHPLRLARWPDLEKVTLDGRTFPNLATAAKARPDLRVKFIRSQSAQQNYEQLKETDPEATWARHYATHRRPEEAWPMDPGIQAMLPRALTSWAPELQQPAARSLERALDQWPLDDAEVGRHCRPRRS